MSLEQVFADARRLPRVHHQMEARLAMAEVSRNAPDAAKLAREASEKGYRIVARKARELAGEK